MRSLASRMAVACLFAGMLGCNELGRIHEGVPRGSIHCTLLADCKVEVPECREATCESGICVFHDAIEGTPLSAQTPGDCSAIVCDGSGQTKKIAAPLDAEDDSNPCTSDTCACTNDTCSETVPAHSVLPQGPCYTGPEGTRGIGICKAGVQQCDAEGRPVGRCVDQTTPAPETCLTAADDDCDGIVNEGGEGCVCGDGYLSTDVEACDDGNTAGGDGCTAKCRWPAVQVTAGGGYTCAFLKDKSTKCWGAGVVGAAGEAAWGGKPGQMGNNLPVLALGAGRTTIAVSATLGGGCAVLDGGQVKCWGHNMYGQLGLGDTSDRGDDGDEMGDNLPAVELGAGNRAVAVAAGALHTCALLDDGKVKCWGNNEHGQLGIGKSGIDESGINDDYQRGDQANEMGDNLPAVDLGAQKRAVAIAVATSHTCALLDGGSVKCWGHNEYGQLGLGDTKQRGAQPASLGDNLPAVDLGTGRTAVAIAAAGYRSCALLDDGRVKCWGNNDIAPLGLGDMGNHRGDEPGEMGDELPTIDLSPTTKAKAIAAGDSHTCALLDDGSVKCWGLNTGGELGIGDTSWHGFSGLEMGDYLPIVDLGVGETATAISAGWSHACAILQSGGIKCWGRNQEGQLGLGDTSDRGDGPGEMGDDLPVATP